MLRDTFEHFDTLDSLNGRIALRDKLMATHQSLNKVFPFIARIAIALYDPKTKMLKTFLHSSGHDNPLDHYQVSIDEAPSLKAILEQCLPRVINKQLTYEHGQSEHTRRIGRQGYAASYTLPMYNDGDFFGFIFFNAYEAHVFTENVLRQIDIYGHLISLMVIKDLLATQMLLAAVKTTGQITHVRDPETGSHLDRMSRYSRLIALGLADRYHFDDSYIEYVFMFSPLHDIGKIAIPDDILLKTGKLTAAEMTVMRTHTTKGGEIISDLVANFSLDPIEFISVLRNIVMCHHEAVNGSGYPNGLKREAIP